MEITVNDLFTVFSYMNKNSENESTDYIGTVAGTHVGSVVCARHVVRSV